MHESSIGNRFDSVHILRIRISIRTAPAHDPSVGNRFCPVHILRIRTCHAHDHQSIAGGSQRDVVYIG